MPLTVEQILESDIFTGVVVIAGAKGLSNPIRWAHVCELPTSGQYLMGNELVLTTGEFLNTRGDRIEFIQGMALAKIAALVLFVEPGTRKIPSYWIEMADEWAIPVLMAPNHKSFVQISEEVNILVQGEAAKEAKWRSPRSEMVVTNRIMAFFQDVLSGEIAGRGVVELAADRLGLPSGGRYCAIFFNYLKEWPEDKIHQAIDDTIAVISESSLPAWCIPADYWHSRITIVISVSEEESPGDLLHVAASINSRLEKRFPKQRVNRIGIGRAYPIYELPKSYREARQASEKGLDLQRKPSSLIQYFGDLGLYRLLYAVEDKRELVSFYRESVSRLIEYDRAYKHDLLRTMEVYFQYEGNLSETAEALFIHRHTLRYRLQRVEELTGLRLKRFEDRLTLLLGLMIWRMLERRA